MKRQGAPGAARWLTVVILTLALAPAIAACGSDPSTISRVISVLTNDETPLPDEAQKQLARFETIFKAYSAQPDDKDRLKYFEFAFRRVRVGYVHDVSDATLIDAAIRGVRETKAQPGTLASKKLVETALETMVSSLDPHSSYLNADEFRETFVQTSGEFGGLGIEITMEDGLVKVIAAIEDTPAERAGLKSGDLIIKVDGQPIHGKSLVQAVKAMRGHPGTDITLTIRRAGGADFPVTITRAIVKIRAVRWRVEDNIAYIRITRFTEKVEIGIGEAMAGIRAALGNRRPAGMVLDLRNNPGGLLDQSLAAASAFLNDGEMVSIRGRNRGQDRYYRARPGDVAAGAPMVVLINGGSASASEIVASALQFHRRATVLGTRSFGKGTVQTILPLPVEGGLRLTTALYYAPDGHTIQARGVGPDIVLTPVKAPTNARREADLPGALAGEAKDARVDSRPTVPEEACPPSSDKEDRQIGCAIAYLQAGSINNFLAMTGQRSRI